MCGILRSVRGERPWRNEKGHRDSGGRPPRKGSPTMAREFTPSASQERALALFGLACDDTHAGAKAVLLAAGLTENGIPAGLTPQKAKKLSDEELRAAFGVAVADAATASEAGLAEIEAAR